MQLLGKAPASLPLIDDPTGLCGPRCLLRVLEFYDERLGVSGDRSVMPELTEIVQQVQWPDVKNGTTLLEIRAFLEQRKIHTLPIEAKRFRADRWTFPIIVYSANDEPARIGHFTVIEELVNGRAQLWDGLSQTYHSVPACFTARSPEILLLTSPYPIDLCNAIGRK